MASQSNVVRSGAVEGWKLTGVFTVCGFSGSPLCIASARILNILAQRRTHIGHRRFHRTISAIQTVVVQQGRTRNIIAVVNATQNG